MKKIVVVVVLAILSFISSAFADGVMNSFSFVSRESNDVVAHGGVRLSVALIANGIDRSQIDAFQNMSFWYRPVECEGYTMASTAFFRGDMKNTFLRFATLCELEDDCAFDKDFVTQKNEEIESIYGFENLIPMEVASPLTSTVFLTGEKLEARWDSPLRSLKMEFNGRKGVDAITGVQEIAHSEVNGVQVHHVKINEHIVASFVFLDELGTMDLDDSFIQTADLDWDKEEFLCPSFSVSAEKDFLKTEELGFLADRKMRFFFTEDENPSSISIFKQKTILSFDRSGISAKAVTLAVSVSRGLTLPPKAPTNGLIVQRPFMVTFSAVEDGQLSVPLFTATVIDPKNK